MIKTITPIVKLQITPMNSKYRIGVIKINRCNHV